MANDSKPTDPLGRWAPYARWAVTVALLIFVVPRLGPGVTLPPLPVVPVSVPNQ